MPGPVVFFAQSSSFEDAWQCASLALTATAMGDDVFIVFSFEALRALARNQYGKPVSEREAVESTRAEALGAPSAQSMLADAREMGARLIACDTMIKLCGLTPADLTRKLDEVMGLASVWKLTSGARVLNF